MPIESPTYKRLKSICKLALALSILLPLTLFSCAGNSIHSPASDTDSDSVHAIVTIVDTTTICPDSTIAMLSPQQIDSLVFRLTHHYSYNFNFHVKADSLQLLPREGDFPPDTFTVYKDEFLVVADIILIGDNTWIKVARDQATMGWITEQNLLSSATPDDSISELLYIISSSRGIWMSAFAGIGLLAFLWRRKRHHTLQILQFDQMHSPYPQLFLCLVAVMASIYASVQNLVPEYWQEFYFHPTLNPLLLPPIMASLVISLWLLIITFIAVIDEIYHHYYSLPGLAYIIELLGVGMIVYLIISWTTLFYVGYILLPVFIYANIRLYRTTKNV